MKKILILSLLFFAASNFLPAYSSELEDDYLDIASNYCVVGDYNSALEYLEKVLRVNPSNQKALDLKKGLNHVISGDKKSFIENVNPIDFVIKYIQNI